MRLIALAILLASSTGAAAETGTVRFVPVGDQTEVPKRYKLAERTFDWTMTFKQHLPNLPIDIYAVTFPSPVTTPTPENNTVHAAYYRPQGDGPFPAVIVLDITGGDQSLSRFISATLAQNKIAALFVQMAYYGPRRPPGSKLRLLSANIPHTVEAVTQTVLDCRFAAAWLAARPEVDVKRIGIIGTSLGSFISALTGEMDRRISRVAILLGGGNLVDSFYEHPMAAPIARLYETFGGSRDKVKALIGPVDPITRAANLKDRQVLMIGAKRDEIIPPSATTALWEAAGKPKIVWYDCTHYGAALFIPFAVKHVVDHFGAK